MTPPWWLPVTWAARLKFGKWKPKRRSGLSKWAIWRWGLQRCIGLTASFCVYIVHLWALVKCFTGPEGIYEDRMTDQAENLWLWGGSEWSDILPMLSHGCQFAHDNMIILTFAHWPLIICVIRVKQLSVHGCVPHFVLSGWSGIPALQCCSREPTTAACGCGRSLQETVKPSRVLDARPPVAKSYLTVRDEKTLILTWIEHETCGFIGCGAVLIFYLNVFVFGGWSVCLLLFYFSNLFGQKHKLSKCFTFAAFCR